MVQGSIFKKAFTLSVLVIAGGGLASCNKSLGVSSGDKAHINNKTKFSSAEYGVKSSPRLTTSKNVRKGGGRYQVGKPYKIRGRWYHPKEDMNYKATGIASWYGPNFHGRLTANGEIYDQYALSAAHPTMPLPSYAEVTNLSNGAKVVVRVNDRGPYSRGRIIDLSAKAAELLDYQKAGVTKVRVKYLGKARMDGLDHKQLLASYRPPKSSKPIDNSVLLANAKVKKERKPEPVTLAAYENQKSRAKTPATKAAEWNTGFDAKEDAQAVRPQSGSQEAPISLLPKAKPAVKRPTNALSYMSEGAINKRIYEAFEIVGMK